MIQSLPIPNRSKIARSFIRTAALVVLATATLTVPSQALAQALESKTIKVGSLDRTYSLYVSPSCQRPRAKCPMLLGFHGGGLRGVSGRQFAESGDFVAAARRRNVIMLFPDAIDRNWNDGRTGTSDGIDDIGFVRALIARTKADVPGFDPTRIYATGMSNGGHLSFRLACEMPGTITAIAPVAATITADLSKVCKPAKAVSILNILGERDPISPYMGGQIKGGRGAITSASQTLAFWQQANACQGAVAETRKGAMTVRRFDRCAAGTRIEQLSLSDGGHTWPGHPGARIMTRLVGPTSMTIDATGVIFDFFGITDLK